MAARSRLAALKRMASGELPCGRAEPAAACKAGVKKVAPRSSAESVVVRRGMQRMRKLLVLLNTSAEQTSRAAKDGRFQRGSWPAGQGDCAAVPPLRGRHTTDDANKKLAAPVGMTKKPGAQTGQLAEKILLSVIPSATRNLLFVRIQEKADSWGRQRPRNDMLDGF